MPADALKENTYGETKVYSGEIAIDSLPELIRDTQAYLSSIGLEISLRVSRGSFSVTINAQSIYRSFDDPTDKSIKCNFFVIAIKKTLSGDIYPSIIGYKTFVSCK